MPRKSKLVKLSSTQFAFEVTDSTPQYYANFVAVAHTSYDFSLIFAKVPAPPTAEQLAIAQSGKPVRLEPLMQIVIPAKLIQGVIDALKTQKEKYETNFGVIEQPKNIKA